MNSEEKKSLAIWLATLDTNERLKLMKRASQIRKGAVRRISPTDDDEDEEGIAPPVKTKARPLDEILWRLRQEEPEKQPSFASGQSGLVVEVGRRFCKIQLEGEVVDCLLSAETAAGQQADLAVGDLATFQSRGGRNILSGVAPRKTVLSRPDVGAKAKERVIVANVDWVVIVVSVGSPPLHPRIIDRYLISIQRGGCSPAIALNKVDLLEESERTTSLALLEPYRQLGIPVVACSAAQGVGQEELRRLLAGSLAAFVGHSGVGKSSLINALEPSLELAVGNVSAGYGRGTHTTTHSSLKDLGDLRVIDTPGIRSFGLWKIDPEDLPVYFPEFSDLRCRFRDCRHLREPGCGVKEAIQRNPNLRQRYETYLRVLDSLS